MDSNEEGTAIRHWLWYWALPGGIGLAGYFIVPESWFGVGVYLIIGIVVVVWIFKGMLEREDVPMHPNRRA